MSLASSFRVPMIPGSTGTTSPQVTVQPTDTVGPQMAKFQAEMMKWQQEQQAKNAMMGQLFGLAGSALGGWATNNFPAFWK